MRLNDVATALIAKGKLEGVNGQNAPTKSIELQREYVLRDAKLVMDLSNINNGQVLQLMDAIAQLTGTISAWWSKSYSKSQI